MPEGCQFEYPEMTVPDGEVAISQRDVALDLEGCRVLVEQGVPSEGSSEPDIRSLGSEFTAVTVGTGRQSSDAGENSAMMTEAAAASTTTYWKTGYNHVYWTDAIGGAVAGSETDIKWHYGTGCAFAGTGANTMYGYAPTGWYALHYPWWSQTNPCSYYKGDGEDGVARNDSFCGLSSVTITFDYTTAKGSSTGGLSGTHNSYRSSSCAPLFKNNTIRVTGSGRDPSP
jgi:hypothetical protein